MPPVTNFQKPPTITITRPDSSELEPLLKRTGLADAEPDIDCEAVSSYGDESDTSRGVLSRALDTVRMAARQQASAEIAHKDQLVFYNHESLLSWKVFGMLGRSVFNLSEVKVALFSYVCLSFGSAIFVAFLVPSARKLDTSRFFYCSAFLKVFITFMLGIYIQRSFTRWWSNMSEFRKVLLSVKQLVFICYCTDIPTEQTMRIQRYCMALCYIFSTEMQHAQELSKIVDRNMQSKLDWLVENDFLFDHEVAILRDHDGKFSNISLVVWTWIGQAIKELRLEMAEMGKPLLPPVFVKLMGTNQNLMTTIENLRMNISVQVPMLYAHLLAWLVHLNNVLLCVLTGLAMGSAMVEIVDRFRHIDDHNASSVNFRLSDPDVSGGQHIESAGDQRRYLTGELYEAVQTFIICLITVLVEPTLYLAFLKIAQMLQYPFGTERYHLPSEFFIARLHVELTVMWQGWKSSSALRRKGLNTKDSCLGETSDDRRGNNDDSVETPVVTTEDAGAGMDMDDGD